MQFWEQVFIGEKNNPVVHHHHNQHYNNQHQQQPHTFNSAPDSSKLSESDSGNYSAVSNGGLKISHENVEEVPVTTDDVGNTINGSPKEMEATSVDSQTTTDHCDTDDSITSTSSQVDVRRNSDTNTTSANDTGDNEGAESIELGNLPSKLEGQLSCNDAETTSEEDANSTLSDSTSDKSKMTDSVKTLTGGDLCRPPSMDDTCIPGRGFPEPDDPSQLLMEHHRPNAMRKVYSSPDSPRTARLIRTKSVPDIVTASLGIETTADMGVKHPSIEGNKNLLNKNLLKDYSRYIDCDGLTIYHNYIDYKLLNIEERHSQEMAKLQKRIQIERQARIGLQQQLQKLSVRESGDYSPVTFSDASHDDLVSILILLYWSRLDCSGNVHWLNFFLV